MDFISSVKEMKEGKKVIGSTNFDTEVRLILINQSGEDRTILIKKLIKKELGL